MHEVSIAGILSDTLVQAEKSVLFESEVMKMSLDEFFRVRAIVANARSYLDVFAIPPGDRDAQVAYVKKLYRQNLLVAHPDRVGSGYRDAANETMALLVKYYNQARQAIEEGGVGMIPSSISFDSASAAHQTQFQLVDDCDMAQCYYALTQMDTTQTRSFLKLSRTTIDNELLATEANALRRLRDGGDAKRLIFYSDLIDTFGAEIAGRRLRANVFRRLDGFYSLAQIKQVYKDGVSALHMGWMWRRILWALDYVHRNGVVHGAVLPQNIMVLPEQHGVVLVDWCYATLAYDKVYRSLKAIVGQQREWYPKEILQKASVVPAMDITMAARSMVYLMGGDPVTGDLPDRVPALTRRYFRELIVRGMDKKLSVPDVAHQFDLLLEKLGAPYYPRRFQVFSLNAS